MKYEYTELELAEQEGLKKRKELRGGEILAELHGIMAAGPRKPESRTESLTETFATLDDLNENVGENFSVADYGYSLSDMAACNEQFSTEEILNLPFAKEDDEALRIAFDSGFEEISAEAMDDTKICNRQDDKELAGNRASRVINEDGNSEIEIKEESATRSETLVRGKKKRGRKRKGAVKSDALPVQDLPERYREHIDKAGGIDIKLIFQKKLSKSDVDPKSARLAMSRSKILRDDFLVETKSVKEGEQMDVNLVDGQLKERSIRMGVWKTMGATYVLKKPWNDVVRENELKKEDEVQLWSFRVGGELRLALVVLSKSATNGGENSQI